GAALLGQFEKQGVNADTMMAGLRTAIAKIATVGGDASTVLKGFINDIQNAGTQSEAAQKAVEVFGRKAGPQMAQAIRDGRLELGHFVEQLNQTGTTIGDVFEQTKDFPEVMKQLKRDIEVGLLPLGNALMVQFKDLLEAITPLIQDGLLRLGAAFAALSPFMQQVTIGVAALAAGLGPMLILISQIGATIPGMITGLKLLTTRTAFPT